MTWGLVYPDSLCSCVYPGWPGQTFDTSGESLWKEKQWHQFTLLSPPGPMAAPWDFSLFRPKGMMMDVGSGMWALMRAGREETWISKLLFEGQMANADLCLGLSVLLLPRQPIPNKWDWIFISQGNLISRPGISVLFAERYILSWESKHFPNRSYWPES